MKFEDDLLTYVEDALPRAKQDSKPLTSAIPTEKNIPINSVDEANQTLLYTAVKLGQPILVDICLAKGATVYERDQQLAKDKNFRLIQASLEPLVKESNANWQKHLNAVKSERKSAAQVVTPPSPFLFSNTTSVDNNNQTPDEEQTKTKIYTG